MTNLNPTNYNDWNRIRNIGVEAATWNAPAIHMLVNFNHGALDYNYHNDDVLVVHFPQRDAMYCVSIITIDNRYHVLYIGVEMDRDALIELIRTRIGGGK